MYKDGNRMMAWIAKINRVEKHLGADSLDICTVGGWQCVTRIGDFKEGDLAVYGSIDSWIPNEIFPALSKGKEPSEYNGVKGERLRSVRLRGQLSQGLLLSIDSIEKEITLGECKYAFRDVMWKEGEDVTELLGIQKWERPISPQIAGLARGNFPSEVPKTDQERIQNLGRNLEQWCADKEEWEVTEKLDGSSCTFYLDKENVFHVCSRNLDLKFDENNAFWQMAIKYDVENKMRNYGLVGFAFQGELIGNKVNGNIYKMSDIDFYVFDVFSAATPTTPGTYLSAPNRINLCARFGLKHVPVIFPVYFEMCANNCTTIDSLLQMAEGKSIINPQVNREGLVFKNIKDLNVSFKAISNAWLLKNE